MSEISIKIPDTDNRILYLCDEIDSKLYTDLMKDLRTISNKDDECSLSIQRSLGMFGIDASGMAMPAITMYINSPGGEAYSGLALFDMVDVYNRTEGSIDTHCDGLCASAAVLPYLAGKHRTCGKNASFMIHSVASFVIGKLKTMEENVAECKRLEKRYFDIIVKHTSITKDQLQEISKTKKDWWITADEAKKLGIVDEII